MGLTTSSQKKEQTHFGCVSAVATLASPESRQKMKTNAKVLVVGSGCAGLAAAWHLNRAGVNVTIYESLGELGGHANTINGKKDRCLFLTFSARITSHFVLL